MCMIGLLLPLRHHKTSRKHRSRENISLSSERPRREEIRRHDESRPQEEAPRRKRYRRHDESQEQEISPRPERSRRHEESYHREKSHHRGGSHHREGPQRHEGSRHREGSHKQERSHSGEKSHRGSHRREEPRQPGESRRREESHREKESRREKEFRKRDEIWQQEKHEMKQDLRRSTEDALARLCLSLEKSLLDEQRRWRDQEYLDMLERQRLGLERWAPPPFEEAPPYSLRDGAAAAQQPPAASDPQHQTAVADYDPTCRSDRGSGTSAECCRHCRLSRRGAATAKSPTVPELDGSRDRVFEYERAAGGRAERA